jgi:carbamate kinase
MIAITHRSALIAVGGNSLIRAGQKGSIPEQMENARQISRAIVTLLKDGLRLVVTHGNGPQVGAALLRSERAAGQVYEQGLDVCVAATQGEIGYILQQSMQREILDAGLRHHVAAVVTQVLVRADDPAFQNPTKPIGPFYSESVAEEKIRTLGWRMVEDASRGYRRVVPSPEPVEIIEAEAIRLIMKQGILVIATGGGGIPVIRANGCLKGVDAVIDKDRASMLLAEQLGVDLLVFSTDADHVYLDYRKPGQRALKNVVAREIRGHMEAGQFPPGSMGPKVEATLNFLEHGGKEAVITSLETLVEAVHGSAGTHITPDLRRGRARK